VRDQWIGWQGEDFVAQVRENPSDEWARWVVSALAEQIEGIYTADFLAEGIIAPEDLLAPRTSVIPALLELGAEARQRHQLYPKASEHKSAVSSDSEWEGKARSYLFRAKRAGALAAVLSAKLRLKQAGFIEPRREDLVEALRNPDGRAALRDIVRRVKATHVGIDMMDITLCGAIQPYNAILGGKLVSLLMASPEVAEAYQQRYADAASVIASSMAGRAVRRQPRLVLLGTTSLYGVGSSQYNRVRMAAPEAGGTESEEIRYVELGRTLGYGSFHFSSDTLAESERLWAQDHGARLVHSIFGEGVNPRLRKIRDALDAVGLPSEPILRHVDRRIIYGIPLAANFRQVLLGVDAHPSPILPRYH